MRKMTKGRAFVMCYVAVNSILAVMIAVSFFAKDFGLIPVGGCLTALVSITGAYIGMQIVNNGVMGKNWSQDMFDSLNKPEQVQGAKGAKR